MQLVNRRLHGIFFDFNFFIMSVIRPEHIRQLPSFRFIDARSGPDAADRFRAGHLQGAIHADLDRVLADIGPDAAQGGRHPLPDPARFARWLGDNGIAADTVLVVYDDKAGANAAARFWWMMKSLGHSQVLVVSGGLPALLSSGWELTDETNSYVAIAPYPVQSWQWPIASIDTVAAAATDPARMVIDVREGYRYRGEKEPIDQVAGHIPGAVNIPYLENLDESGHFLEADVLNDKYAQLLEGKDPSQLIIHCGSGVTACHSLLALHYAGLEGATLYPGSWSEWSRNDRPIASGEQP